MTPIALKLATQLGMARHVKYQVGIRVARKDFDDAFKAARPGDTIPEDRTGHDFKGHQQEQLLIP